MNLGFVIFGVIAVIAGLVMLVVAIRNRGDGEDPKMTIMLMAGMMVTAFGMLIAGFSIGYSTADPLAPSSAEATP
jgi:zinc transporter ZupT